MIKSAATGKKHGYHFIRNSQYAFAGLWDMLCTETSFRLELCVSIVLWIFLPTLSFPLEAKLILGLSLFLPLIAEAINSAIERVVDLVTVEYNVQAKRAKDVGSAIVFLSLIFTSLIWVSIIYYYLLM